VGLKHGGYLLFEEGETLTAVDVNSGRDTRGLSERTGALLVNMEAAGVVAEQLRLRDIGGVIVVDFIDMATEEDRTEVREHFEACTRWDRGRVRVEGFTRRGLLELTRKRADVPLRQVVSITCPLCGKTKCGTCNGGESS
jgi:ribonuclease G